MRLAGRSNQPLAGFWSRGTSRWGGSCGPWTVFRPRLPGQRLPEGTNNMSSALRELHTYLSLELRKQIEVSPKRSHTLQVHFSPSLSLFHAFETYETEWKSFKCCQTYVVQLEKSISQRCDTKCCHTNVAADPTIIECDEDVMLWGKMFDCNWVIIGLDLGVGDLFWKFIFSLNRASIQNSIQSKIQNIHSKNIHSIE